MPTPLLTDAQQKVGIRVVATLPDSSFQAAWPAPLLIFPESFMTICL